MKKIFILPLLLMLCAFNSFAQGNYWSCEYDEDEGEWQVVHYDSDNSEDAAYSNGRLTVWPDNFYGADDEVDYFVTDLKVTVSGRSWWDFVEVDFIEDESGCHWPVIKSIQVSASKLKKGSYLSLEYYDSDCNCDQSFSLSLKGFTKAYNEYRSKR